MPWSEWHGPYGCHADALKYEPVPEKWVPSDLRGLRVGAPLSDREIDVLRGMSHGLTNEQIARDLDLSEGTVKTHVRRILRKLEARDRIHAVTIGYQRGVLVLNDTDDFPSQLRRLSEQLRQLADAIEKAT